MCRCTAYMDPHDNGEQLVGLCGLDDRSKDVEIQAVLGCRQPARLGAQSLSIRSLQTRHNFEKCRVPSGVAWLRTARWRVRGIENRGRPSGRSRRLADTTSDALVARSHGYA